MRVAALLAALALSSPFELATASKCKPSTAVAGSKASGTVTSAAASETHTGAVKITNVIDNGHLGSNLDGFVTDSGATHNSDSGFTGDGSVEHGCASLPASGSPQRKRASSSTAKLIQQISNLSTKDLYTIRLFYAAVVASDSVGSCQLECSLGQNSFLTTTIPAKGASSIWSQVLAQVSIPSSDAALTISVSCDSTVDGTVLVESIFMSNQVTPETINNFVLDFGDGTVSRPGQPTVGPVVSVAPAGATTAAAGSATASTTGSGQYAATSLASSGASSQPGDDTTSASPEQQVTSTTRDNTPSTTGSGQQETSLSASTVETSATSNYEGNPTSGATQESSSNPSATSSSNQGTTASQSATQGNVVNPTETASLPTSGSPGQSATSVSGQISSSSTQIPGQSSTTLKTSTRNLISTGGQSTTFVSPVSTTTGYSQTTETSSLVSSTSSTNLPTSLMPTSTTTSAASSSTQTLAPTQALGASCAKPGTAGTGIDSEDLLNRKLNPDNYGIEVGPGLDGCMQACVGYWDCFVLSYKDGVCQLWAGVPDQIGFVSDLSSTEIFYTTSCLNDNFYDACGQTGEPASYAGIGNLDSNPTYKGGENEDTFGFDVCHNWCQSTAGCVAFAYGAQYFECQMWGSTQAAAGFTPTPHGDFVWFDMSCLANGPES